MKIFIFLIFIFSNIYALELDSKFIARLLGVSDTKKTLLVNKGNEIGLKVGNHAKVSLPSGTIARAVVVKLSPSRSIWSVYRFMKKEKIISEIAVTFKISSPVKLTTDESKKIGILADKIDVKREKIPTEQKSIFVKKQRALRNQLKRSENTMTHFGNVDYSSLEDTHKLKKPSKEIDWSALNGSKDDEFFDQSIDYSALR